MANARRRIGTNIYTIMQSKGLSQETFAERIHYSNRDVCRVIEGRVFLPPAELKKIAGILGTSQEKLLNSTSDKVVPELQYMKAFDDPDNLDRILDLIDEYMELKENM